jgi:hypothetical protein
MPGIFVVMLMLFSFSRGEEADVLGTDDPVALGDVSPSQAIVQIADGAICMDTAALGTAWSSMTNSVPYLSGGGCDRVRAAFPPGADLQRILTKAAAKRCEEGRALCEGRPPLSCTPGRSEGTIFV